MVLGQCKKKETGTAVDEPSELDSTKARLGLFINGNEPSLSLVLKLI